MAGLVCYSTGTISSLLDKLASMKNHSNSTEEFSNLTEKFKKAVLSVKEDFLDKLAVPKVCKKQVRELVFKIEDWIDQKPETNVLDPWDIEKIKTFMIEIKEARERFTWYYDLLKEVPTEPDVAAVAASNMNINPRVLVDEKPCHGLLNGPRDELLKHLTDNKDDMRKVVSVVGIEGLGKTTLAKEIYSELQLRRQFECQAFVSVGRTTSMKWILYMILHQLNPLSEKLKPGIDVDVKEIITELGEYLSTKRYFILVDGIWSTWAWRVINSALPNNHGSRVLTTTCIMDIGIYCSSYPNDLVYQMKALNKENSKNLFLSKKISLQEEEKWEGYDDNSCYMLEICDGMPLAIIVAAGLLFARKYEEPVEVKILGEYILLPFKQYSTSEGMNKILQMSYADLSPPLRSCLLYLSVFPENYTIRRVRLILLWTAEGFVPRIGEECLLETGERYFNELISRRLIQPVFNCDDDFAVGCTVHNVILDFIRSISKEENFATRATELNPSQFPCDTIRRFSMDCGNKDEAVPLFTSSVHLSSMRSLTVFGDVEGKLYPPDDEWITDTERLPSVSKHGEEMYATKAPGVSINIFSAFKILRVLDLADTRNLKHHHLDGIGRLVLLRYLGLAGTGITELTEEIGGLEQLETLDLRRNIGLVSFPASIVKLQKLTNLLLDEMDAMGIWEMPELEVTSGFHVSGSSSLVKVSKLLRKSERLRILHISTGTFLTETDLVSFLDEVVKSKLQFLGIHYKCHGPEAIPLLVNSWKKVTAPLEKIFELQRFYLNIYHPYRSVLPNIGSFPSLTHLDIKLYEARADDFLVLEGLTNLVFLYLTAQDCFAIERFIMKGGIFPFLKDFLFRISNNWMGLEFEEGAMPQLQRLGRVFYVSKRGGQEYPDIGIEHLNCLTRIRALIFCTESTVSEVEAAERAIRGPTSEIATKPTLELRRLSENLMRNDEQGHHSLVSPFRRQLSEGTTSIQQVQDDEQIREDEGENAILVPSSGRQVSEKAKKSAIESNYVFKKMKNLRKFIGLHKLSSQKSNKHKLKSNIKAEDQQKKLDTSDWVPYTLPGR